MSSVKLFSSSKYTFCRTLNGVSNSAGNCSRGRGQDRAIWGLKQGPKMAHLLDSASVQASSPSAQAKAAAALVGDRNWNWKKKILCPTTWVQNQRQMVDHILDITIRLVYSLQITCNELGGGQSAMVHCILQLINCRLFQS